jgi:hypothetical protein
VQTKKRADVHKGAKARTHKAGSALKKKSGNDNKSDFTRRRRDSRVLKENLEFDNLCQIRDTDHPSFAKINFYGHHFFIRLCTVKT